jgi:hypothetical protein
VIFIVHTLHVDVKGALIGPRSNASQHAHSSFPIFRTSDAHLSLFLIPTVTYTAEAATMTVRPEDSLEANGFPFH